MTRLTPEQKERWFPRLTHLAGAALVVLTALGFYLFAYQPLVRQQLEDTDRADRLELLIAQGTTIHAQHTRLRKELSTLTSQVETIRARIPQEPMDAEFVRDIRQLAAEAGVTVHKHRVGTPQRLSTHSQAEVHFDCQGRYDSICQFLHQVEQVSRLVKVAKLEVGTADNSEVYPLQITFVLYYGLPSNDTNQRRQGLSGKQA